MNRRAPVVLLLIATLCFGLLYASKAYAHNFGGEESAASLAKARVKTKP